MRFVALSLMISLGLAAQANAAEVDPNAPTPRMAIKFLHEQVPHYGGYNHWDTTDEHGYRVSRNNVTKVKIENNALNLDETVIERGAKEVNGDKVYKARFSNFATRLPLAELNPESTITLESYGVRLQVKCQSGPCMTVSLLEVVESEADSQFSAYRKVKGEFEDKLEKNAPRAVSQTDTVSISFIERVRAERVSRALAYLIKELQKK